MQFHLAVYLTTTSAPVVIFRILDLDSGLYLAFLVILEFILNIVV